jgi:hypothetical protein
MPLRHGKSRAPGDIRYSYIPLLITTSVPKSVNTCPDLATMEIPTSQPMQPQENT